MAGLSSVASHIDCPIPKNSPQMVKKVKLCLTKPLFRAIIELYSAEKLGITKNEK